MAQRRNRPLYGLVKEKHDSRDRKAHYHITREYERNHQGEIMLRLKRELAKRHSSKNFDLYLSRVPTFPFRYDLHIKILAGEKGSEGMLLEILSRWSGRPSELDNRLVEIEKGRFC
jgi:hypothetical protein